MAQQMIFVSKKTKTNEVLFTILCPFEIRESIRRKVDHEGQIVLWYWQHATNLARATVFLVCTVLVCHQ
jgi:hypothetical protein